MTRIMACNAPPGYLRRLDLPCALSLSLKYYCVLIVEDGRERQTELFPSAALCSIAPLACSRTPRTSIGGHVLVVHTSVYTATAVVVQLFTYPTVLCCPPLCRVHRWQKMRHPKEP